MKKRAFIILLSLCFLLFNSNGIAMNVADTTLIKEYIAIGQKLRKSGKLDSALVYLEKANELSKKTNFSEASGEALYHLGLTNRDIGNYKAALNYIDLAIDIAQKTGNKKKIALFNNGKGQIFRKQGLYTEALSCLYNSLKIRESIHDSMGIASSLTNIGSVYDEQRNFEKAIEKHLQAIAIRKAIGDEEGLAPCYGNLAGVYLEQKKYSEALHYQSLGLEIEKKFNNKQDMASSISNIGLIYATQSDYDNALKYQLEALRLKEEIGNQSAILASLINIGALYLSTNNLKQSETYLMNAFNLSGKIDDLDSKMEAAKNLHELFEKKKQVEKALFYYKEFISAKEKLINIDNIKETERIVLNYEFEKRELQQKAQQEKREAVILGQLQLKEMQVSRNRIILASLIALFIVTIIIAYLLFKQNKIKAKQNYLQLEQQLLRSQMNPHFIFNSINSIQRYILQKDQQTAYDYLAKFSKLIRLVLNNSQEKILTIKQELDLIRLYVELEQLRFDNKFEFTIRMPDDLDEETLRVPCLLIQPYVENAIWHGLMNLDKSKRGKLIIDLQAKDKNLLITIEDNGIGRKLAQSYKAVDGEKSMGMKLSEQRIQMINKMQNYENAKVKVIDLHDEKGIAIGTRVEIVLPLNILD